MRQLIFKNVTLLKSKKRDVSVEEIVRRNGIVSCTKKRSMYFIRDSKQVKNKEELQEWIKDRKKNASLNRRFFHILRQYSAVKKEDKLICKMRGSFYVISGESVYNIVFIHAIKIKIMRPE